MHVELHVGTDTYPFRLTLGLDERQDLADLRNDIRVPDAVLAKWTRDMERQPEQRAHLDRVLEYRRAVLAIFDSLIRNASPRIQ